jgi:hypothetical protein
VASRKVRPTDLKSASELVDGSVAGEPFGMGSTKHRFMLFAGLGTPAALLLACYSVTRPIAFEKARWSDPSWPWDRWRMVEDLGRRLAEDRPTFDEAMEMLEGTPESRHATRNLELSAGKQENYLD